MAGEVPPPPPKPQTYCTKGRQHWMRELVMDKGLWFWREQKGLYARRITTYPTYIKGKVVSFNSSRFLRNAADKAALAQFPTLSATTIFKGPRESAPQILKHQRTLRGWRIKWCLLIRHISHANGRTQTAIRYGTWASREVGPTSPKPSSPTKKSGSRILRGYYGAWNSKF